MPLADRFNKPIFFTPEINSSLKLGMTKARIGNCIGYCRFEYKWLPFPGIHFTFSTENILDHKDFAIGESGLFIPPESAQGIPIRIGSNYKIEYKGFLAKTDIELRIPITSTNCDIVLFHIPNYIGFGFGPIGLDLRDWDIMLYTVPNFKDLINQLSENGGYAITQFGILKRKDKKSFAMSDVQDVLNPLRDLLSFLEGGWCSPLFPVGMTNSGQIAWMILDTEIPSQWIKRHRLVDSVIDLLELNAAFKRLAEIRAQNSNSMLRVGAAIGMYIDACHATNEPSALILSQAAMELLVWLWAEDHPEKLNEELEKFKEKGAAVKLSWLFDSFNIPANLPETLKKIKDYSLKFEALKDADGPKVITYMRNGLIHPTSKNIKRAIGLRTEDLPAISEASTLCKEYLALILLGTIGYNGNYNSQVDRTTKPVPWSVVPNG